MAHFLVRPTTYRMFVACVVLGTAATARSQSGPGASVSVPDSTIARIAALVVNDSLGRLRDSIRSGSLSPSRVDSAEDSRPAREVLRVADPTLFASVSGTVGDDYPLGPGDELVLSIWGQKQAQYVLPIDRDGQVQIPSAGTVSLNGANFGDARRLIGRKLSSIYSGVGSGTTQFDLTLGKLKQIRVFVVGEVARPGGYTLQGATSTMQAVALAGGPTARGSDRVANVTNGSTTTTVDLYEYLFLGRRPAGDVLRDGAVVRIPTSLGTAKVRGGVARPGLYEVVPGETSQSLLALAGGLSSMGAQGEPMNLVRASGTYTSAVLVGPNALQLGGIASHPVGPGDVLEVPTKQPARRGSPTISGAVARPGTYPWADGLTLGKLVELAGGPLGSSYLDRVVIFRTDSRGRTFVLSTGLDRTSETPLQFSDSIVVGDVSPVLDTAKTVSIGGAVRNPVTVVWGSGLRLKDLVVLAGGWQPWADPSRIRVDLLSPDGKSFASKTVSLDTLLSASGQDMEIPSAGIVHVPGEDLSGTLRHVVIEGHVAQPGIHALFGGREKVASVVQRAGGLRSEAYASGATLHRKSEGRIPFDLANALRNSKSDDNVLLLDGDSLHIPHVPATVKVEGQVHRATTTLWRKGKDWDWYVRNAGGMTDSAMADGVYVVYADGSMATLEDGIEDPTPGSIVVVPSRVPPPKSTTIEKINAFATIVSAVGAILTVYLLYINASDK